MAEQDKDLIFDDRFECLEQPIADAGGNQQVTVGSPSVLAGSSSGGPACGFLLLWTIVQRPTGSATELFDAATMTPIFIADRAGSYDIELTLFSDGVIAATDMISITATGELDSSADIGADGGAVGLPDGSSVLIPPDALNNNVEVSIETISLRRNATFPPTAVLVSEIYDLKPAGLNFFRPVQIHIPYDVSLLPPDYSEGAITIHRQGDWPEFNMAGSALNDDPVSTSHGQRIDLEQGVVSVYAGQFSAYGALGIRSSAQFTPVTLSEPNASITIRRPPALRTTRPQSHRCAASNTQENLPSRPGSVEAVVIHSTNNGNSTRDFNGELGWGADDCNRFFTHYYIDRDGEIYQVADDQLLLFHTGSLAFGINNGNAIGVELFLNVGEPYDGRQVSSLIRLLDFLAERHQLDRPTRDPATGVFERNLADIALGGDRFIGHTEHAADKCDPSGFFMNSGVIKPEHWQVPQCRDPVDPRVQPQPLPSGSPVASSLMDLVMDALAVLDRNGQHTGVINTHGGDAYEEAIAGNAGSVAFREDSALVDATVGTQVLTEWEQNDPTLLGPGPLIVAPGGTLNLAPGVHEFTDVIVDGDLLIGGDVELRLTGSFYISPIGSIVGSLADSGPNLTVFSRAVPIVQGLIDVSGAAGTQSGPSGGDGGNVEFTYSASGILAVPTIFARGGDADWSTGSAPNAGPTGGDGGTIVVNADQSAVFFGGGIGPVINDQNVPAWHFGPIDPNLLSPPGRWSGDFLPPAPPLNRATLFTSTPQIGERAPKWANTVQPGFRRGLLSAGGMGGAGGSGFTPSHGGQAGGGGSITVTLSPSTSVTFRDVDFATGAEIESLIHRFFLAGGGPTPNLVCTASGAHGGMGLSGGHGGAGGAAGNIVFNGGNLLPAPSQFIEIYEIREFPPGEQMLVTDDFCSRGRQQAGRVVEARSGSGAPLYRLRLAQSGFELLGGLGGIPSQNGTIGMRGENGELTGLAVQ